MVALVLVASIALLLSTEGRMEAELTGRGTEALQADYLAQAALQHAMWQNESLACSATSACRRRRSARTAIPHRSTGGGTTTAYSLSADQDAWIRDDQPTTNNGGDATPAYQESGKIEQPLYRFDLSTCRPAHRSTRRSASFYVSSEHPEGPVTVHRITAAWTEGDVTWDSFGGSVDSQVLAMIPAAAEQRRPRAGEPHGPGAGLGQRRAQQRHSVGLDRAGYPRPVREPRGRGQEQPRLDVVVGTAPHHPSTSRPPAHSPMGSRGP